MESAAADLLGRGPDLTPIGLEHTAGGVVDIRVEQIHHTAGKKPDTPPQGWLSTHDFRCAVCKRATWQAWQHGFQVLQPFWQQMEEPQAAQKRLQARALVQAQHMEELFQAPWIRKEFAKHQKPQQAFGPRAGQVALDLPPRSFHQIAKFDMRGTGGFAGTTIEA
jgi:hypothetical protein